MKKQHLIVEAITVLFGGYWYGYVYAPQMWPHMPKGDISCILMGCFLGYMSYLICILFVMAWRSTK